jgi:hypothetical protein
MTDYSQQLLNAQQLLQARRQQAGINYRPAISLTAAPPQFALTITEPAPVGAPTRGIEEDIYHHGEIALAANRAGQSIHYQLWLALRHIDANGRGWLSQKSAQEAFCAEDGRAYLYKTPRLRQVLREGNNAYWRLDEANGRIFYLKEARLMSHLGLRPLTGRHVAITAGQIFTSIQTFRAHCFAAWLANRVNPISQATIEQLTGIPARTQLRYCQLADVATTANLSIGPRHNQDAAQEAAWRHEGTFKFVDFRGKQGPAGRGYVAWHLPTSYSVNADQGSRRRQKRTNNQTIDLRHNRDAGNGRLVACFFCNGAMAIKAANRQTPGRTEAPTDHYWPGIKARSKSQLWHCLTV